MFRQKNTNIPKPHYLRGDKGFTLAEIMVAMTVFIFIMVMSTGSILSIFSVNQKSKNLRSVMDNVNLTLESMTRTIRFGTKYHCGSGGDVTTPADCSGSGSRFLTVQSGGASVTYATSTSRVTRTVGGVTSFITSPDITITSLVFRVYGSAPYVSGAGGCPASNDCFQPKVIIVVSGYVGVKADSRSTFTLETTVSQRKFDFE